MCCQFFCLWIKIGCNSLVASRCIPSGNQNFNPDTSDDAYWACRMPQLIFKIFPDCFGTCTCLDHPMFWLPLVHLIDTTWFFWYHPLSHGMPWLQDLSGAVKNFHRSSTRHRAIGSRGAGSRWKRLN